MCVGGMCRQALVSGLHSDSGVNNTLGLQYYSVCVREKTRESIVKWWVGVGLVVYVSRWLRVCSVVSMARSMTASLHTAHRCRSAN